MKTKVISIVVFLAVAGILIIGSTLVFRQDQATLKMPTRPANYGGSVSSTSSPVASTSKMTTTTTSTEKTYTLADVAKHPDATSCWTVVNDGVYDLTPFVSQHPGGQGAILSLCGHDGTAAFEDQHGGQRRPANELASLKIGVLTK